MGLISFHLLSWFITTLIPICQVRPNLLKIIINIIKTDLVRILSNKSRDILGVHVWDHLVDGPIQSMVHMEIKVKELLKPSSLTWIQLVQPKIKHSVVKRRNCEVNFIRNIYPLVRWGLTCNISLCHQPTDTTNGLDGNNRARAFQIFFTLPNPTSTVQDTTISNTHKELWGTCNNKGIPTYGSDGMRRVRNF